MCNHKGSVPEIAWGIGAREKYSARPDCESTTLTRFGFCAVDASVGRANVATGQSGCASRALINRSIGFPDGAHSSPCQLTIQLDLRCRETWAARSEPDFSDFGVITASAPLASAHAAIRRSSVATIQRFTRRDF